VLQVNVFLNAGHSNYATKNAHPPTNTTTTTTITTVAGKHKEQNVLCIFEVGHQRSSPQNALPTTTAAATTSNTKKRQNDQNI
jgi:hypothetical protein